MQKGPGLTRPGPFLAFHPHGYREVVYPFRRAASRIR